MKKFKSKYRDYNHDFINGYDVKDGKIIVHQNGNETYEIPYTIEDEKQILYEMRAQVPVSGGHDNDYYRDILSGRILLTFYPLLCVTHFIFGRKTGRFENYLLSGGFAFLTVLYAAYYSKSIKKSDEIEKYNLFLENEDLINEEIIREFNEHQEWVNDESLEPNTMTINDLDHYTYKEILDIIEMIKESNNNEQKLVLK